MSVGMKVENPSIFLDSWLVIYNHAEFSFVNVSTGSGTAEPQIPHS